MRKLSSSLWALAVAACPAALRGDRLLVLSPLEDFSYVSGADVWLNVQLQVDGAELTEPYSRYRLCASVDGAPSQCSGVAGGQPLPTWPYASLTDGDHVLCSWLQEEQEEACQRVLETCVRFRRGATRLGTRVLGVKYGQHGDDAAVSVAVDSMLVTKLSLANTWAALFPEDAAQMIHPGGFCAACGVNDTISHSVSRAGTCDACVPFESLVEKWATLLSTHFTDAELLSLDAVVCNEAWLITAHVTVGASANEDMRSDRTVGAIRAAVERRWPNEARSWAVADPYITVDPALAPGAPSSDVENARSTSASIASLAQTSRPFSVCRPGWGWELTLSHRYRHRNRGLPTQHETALLHMDTGVYGRKNNEGSLTPYFELWNDAMDKCDALVAFPATVRRVADYLRPGQVFLGGGNVLGRGYLDLAPEEAWLTQLVGKRVLVVHQQAALMVQRFANATLRKALWPMHPHALPEFAAVVGYAPVDALDNTRPIEPDWRAATTVMCDDIGHLSEDFDVALISAGGYGHLLLHCVRHAHGKSAVYVGGALSFHFGIISKRTATDPYYKTFINEHFIRLAPPPQKRNIWGYY